MAGTFNDLQLISLARFLCESARNLKLEEQRFYGPVESIQNRARRIRALGDSGITVTLS